ncbi:hypothetical protein T06_8577 [Trichinella sp. T6]|nr:hypothetical protein T06_8577 [Trichinella sp. T6]
MGTKPEDRPHRTPARRNTTARRTRAVPSAGQRRRFCSKSPSSSSSRLGVESRKDSAEGPESRKCRPMPVPGSQPSATAVPCDSTPDVWPSRWPSARRPASATATCSRRRSAALSPNNQPLAVVVLVVAVVVSTVVGVGVAPLIPLFPVSLIVTSNFGSFQMPAGDQTESPAELPG